MKLVYGAGRYGIAFLRAMEAAGEKVAGFVDQYTGEKSVEGKPVWRMDTAPREHEVIVSIPRQATLRSTGIEERLADAGFCHIAGFDQAIATYPRMPRHLAQTELLWLRPASERMLNPPALRELSNLLTDQKSRHVLEALIRFRRTLHGDDYPPPDGQNEYFPADVPWSPSGPLRFVDGGAWVGDTVESLLAACDCLGKEVEWVASFEPDPENFARLSETARRLGTRPHSPELFLWPGGLHAENGLTDLSREGDGSSIDPVRKNTETEQVSLFSLDTILGGAEPNYIKLDIEGVEMSALRGMSNIIETCRPNLAICLYHRPEDLWEIPLWIARRWPDYRFYLRLHGPMGLGTVLYCIQREKST